MRHCVVLVAAAVIVAACSSSDAGPGAAVTAGVATTAIATTAVVTTVPTTTEQPVAGVSTTHPTSTHPASTGVTTTDVQTATIPTTTTRGASDDRPFDVFVPSTYDESTPMPLVVLLHGYTASGDLQEAYFRLQPLAEQRGFLYVHPDGTTDVRGEQFWNATDACCDLGGIVVDDSAYLAQLIQQVQATYNVDPTRIFLIGHSNGGFMSYRMACDHADLIAAIVSVSGATFADPTRCQPSEPVSVLEIHGTADTVIAYDGGKILGNSYPSAPTSVSTWATYNGCGTLGEVQPGQLDLYGDTADAETSVVGYTDCPPTGAVALWTVLGGVHSPRISSTFFDDALDFLYAHPKA
jgi:polyhydroxybutyrate depolymerase